MKRVGIILAAILVASLTVITDSSAQSQGMGRRQGGWGPGSPYARLYNPQTVETMSGVVASIERFTPSKGMSHGVHALLKTDKESIVVHLGPAWFIDNQIRRSDRVIGSRSWVQELCLRESPHSWPQRLRRMEKYLRSEMRAACPFGAAGAEDSRGDSS